MIETNYYAVPGSKGEGLTVSAEVVIQEVCSYYQMDIGTIGGATRKREIAFVRQLLMYLLAKRSRLTYDQIGKLMGGRDHSTVTRAIQAIQDYIDTDSLGKRNEILMHLPESKNVA